MSWRTVTSCWYAQAVVRVMAVDDDGQVHFTVLPGSVDKNRHLIGRALA